MMLLRCWHWSFHVSFDYDEPDAMTVCTSSDSVRSWTYVRQNSHSSPKIEYLSCNTDSFEVCQYSHHMHFFLMSRQAILCFKWLLACLALVILLKITSLAYFEINHAQDSISLTSTSCTVLMCCLRFGALEKVLLHVSQTNFLLSFWWIFFTCESRFGFVANIFEHEEHGNVSSKK